MTHIPLRKTGNLVHPLSSSIDTSDDPPRALRSLARIIDNDLCHRCGTCVGICPTDVLGVDSREYPEVKNLSACTDCDLCVKVCPGDEFDANNIASKIFENSPDIKDMHGSFTDAYLSYALDKEVREKSTSGGLITAVLISLLERKIIDGAIVIASDEKTPWKGKPIVARTKREILDATKSKYSIVPTNAVLKEIRQVEGKYALVGLPCQIHGFHKARLLDKRIRERIIVTFGLFCHAAIEDEAFEEIWKSLGSRTEKAVKFVSRIGKHPGTPHIILSDGTQVPVYFPNARGFRPSSMEIINILYRLYTPARCLTCYDSTAEFADIAVGDPWMPRPSDDINFHDGYSFVFARNKNAQQILREAEQAGSIKLIPLSPEEARTSNQMMGTEKRHRAFRIIETRRRQGHLIPDYGFKIPKLSGKQQILTELNMLSHLLCFTKVGQKQFLRFVLSPAGYALLYLNHLRRSFRTWQRDLRAKLKRARST